MNSTMIGTAIQLVMKTWEGHTNFCSIELLQVLIHLYLRFNYAVPQYQVLSPRSVGFVSRKQEHALFIARTPLQGPDGIDVIARSWTPDGYEAIRYLSYLMLENLIEVISNNSLYSLHDQFSELEKFRFQRDRLLLVFATFLECAIKALNAVRAHQPHVGVKYMVDDGDVVMGPDSHSALTKHYKIWSLLFSAAE